MSCLYSGPACNDLGELVELCVCGSAAVVGECVEGIAEELFRVVVVEELWHGVERERARTGRGDFDPGFSEEVGIRSCGEYVGLVCLDDGRCEESLCFE